MKIKFTTFQILGIILAEVILIEVFLIFSFVKNTSAKASPLAENGDKPATVQTVAVNKPAATGVPSATMSKPAAVNTPAVVNTPASRDSRPTSVSPSTGDTLSLPDPSETASKPKAANESEASSKPVKTTAAVVEKPTPVAAEPFGGFIKKIPAQKQLMAELLKNLSNPVNEARDVKIPDDEEDGKYFIATTYDLSYESCGKYPKNPAYGVTFSGTKAVKGKTIAVDPDVIPLGSSVYIQFPSQYGYLNGWYTAEDTGSKVKGNIIDVFLGESAFKEMEKFGSHKVTVKILYPEKSEGKKG